MTSLPRHLSLLIALLMGGAVPMPALAAGENLKVTSLKASAAGFYEVVVATPTAGRPVTCVLRDASGKTLARNTWISQTPETTVPVRHPGAPPSSAVCAAD
mgnify:FL=1